MRYGFDAHGRSAVRSWIPEDDTLGDTCNIIVFTKRRGVEQVVGRFLE